jgi:hypothetical protein
MLGEELTVRQARELLIEYAAMLASRDARVRAAVAAGVSKAEIHRITGIARTTINDILASDGPGEPSHGPEAS